MEKTKVLIPCITTIVLQYNSCNCSSREKIRRTLLYDFIVLFQIVHCSGQFETFRSS